MSNSSYRFIGDRFVLVEETRTIDQVVRDLTEGMESSEVAALEQMCPFCPLWGSPDVVQQPVGDDFYGTPARVGGIRCCDDCQMALDMLDAEGQAWYVAQVVAQQDERTTDSEVALRNAPYEEGE